MSDTEAGPSQQPVFKKRNRARPPPKASSAIAEPEGEGDGDEDGTPVQDLIALRNLTRKPQGIELVKLNKGEKKKKDKKDKPSSDETQASRGEDDAQARRLVRTDNFQGETGTVDVDKHMMAYIEAEMRKRRSGETVEQLTKAINDPEDELYKVAEKYRALQREARPQPKEDEGSVALSTAMLSSIPEIDLGIDTRMKNIQETEKAKRAFYQHASKPQDADDDYNTRFFKPQHTNHHDLEALRREMRDQDEVEEGVTTTAIDTGIGAKRHTATDQHVMDRFKKRQRNALK